MSLGKKKSKHILKIALVQQKAVPNDQNANLQLALDYLQSASKMGADLVLFPEMWSNGYAPPFEGAFDDPFNPNFQRERAEWLSAALPMKSDYIVTLRKTARQYQIGVVATYLAKTSGKPQNIALVIDKNGDVILQYAKVHTCDFSLEGLLESGDNFKVCTFAGVQIGVMICYDREFPESARALMLKGAEIILVPNACQMDPARINQLSTRAFENMVGVAMANYPAPNWGRSCAFSPIVYDDMGQYLDPMIIQADDRSEQILLAEFALDEIRAYRKAETWGNAYRKPQAYQELLSLAVKEPFIR